MELTFSQFANFHAKQKEVEEAIKTAKFVLYGGAAGGGKSRALRWLALKRLLEFGSKGMKGVRVGLFCEDYPSLNDRQLSKIIYEFPSWLGTLNRGQHDFTLDPKYGGGILSLRNLDDVSKYLSAEFADIYVDELTRNPRKVFDFLTMRLRWPGVTDNKFVAGTNPGSVGHGWVKKLWIDKDFTDERLDPSEFKFIQAKFVDNPHINPLIYGKQLEGLPDQLRKAYKEGDWDIFAGQFFTEFKRDYHVIEPYADEQTLRWFKALPSYCGLDYGYNAPSAVVWGKFWDNTWYIYRELYEKGLTFVQLRDKIMDIEVPVSIYADPSIWAKKDDPTSGADRMRPLPVTPGMNDRIIGWNVCKQALKEKRVKIFSSCINLIRTIPILVYDETKTEDCDTDGDDHLPDAWRYLMATHVKVLQQQIPLSYVKNKGKIINGGGDLDELFVEKKGNTRYLPRYR